MADNMTAIFSPPCLNDAPPGAVVAMMRPQDFLRLAAPIPTRIDSGQRLQAIQDLLDANLSLDSLPCSSLRTRLNFSIITSRLGLRGYEPGSNDINGRNAR